MVTENSSYAYVEGYNAYKNGDACEYPKGTTEYSDWVDGFNDASRGA